MQFGPLTLKHCKYGWMLFSGPFIGKCFELYGEYSESELSVMRLFVREGSVVIDVGANIGDLTLPLSKLVGDKGRIYAFESHPEVFNVLCANLALNNVKNTLPANAFVAMSDAAETGGPWGKFGYVGDRWPTRFVALDSLDIAACDLIKVDVDGHELEVLRSGEMQIERLRPVIYFENDVRESSPDLLSFVMETCGYDVYWHQAPIFDPGNFFGNPVNHWAPHNICSLMMLAIPSERKMQIPHLRKVADKNEWWSE
jgi:FkbM family methyltransferase